MLRPRLVRHSTQRVQHLHVWAVVWLSRPHLRELVMGSDSFNVGVMKNVKEHQENIVDQVGIARAYVQHGSGQNKDPGESHNLVSISSQKVISVIHFRSC